MFQKKKLGLETSGCDNIRVFQRNESVPLWDGGENEREE